MVENQTDSEPPSVPESAHETDLLSSHIANRKVLQLSRKKGIERKSLEECLGAALQATDAELGEILREIDHIFSALKSPHPDKTTLRIAEHPAVWSAMRQAIVERELRQLALTDDLTCLFNRRGFFAAATQQIKRALRDAEPLMLFFCDVDGLKTINDTYGHSEGDLALIRAAEALEKSFRASDIVARLGGDEFVVLALQTGDRFEEIIHRRLTRALRATKSIGNGCSLSLSVGTARFDPKRAVTLGELMSQADKAMYAQKRSRQLTAKLDKPAPKPQCEPEGRAG